jgi:hypothetical protein
MALTPKPAELTLEDMLFGLWAKSVWTAEDYNSIPAEAVQTLIKQTRTLALQHGWTQQQVNNFFRYLRNDLERKTKGHPVTRMIIELLKIETELN